MEILNHIIADIWQAVDTKEHTTDRRNNTYRFKSMYSLIAFFSRSIDTKAIKQIIRKSDATFVVRQGATFNETRLQKIKKVEYTINRVLKYKALQTA